MTDWNGLKDFVPETEKFGVTLTEQQIARFAQYEALLLEWNAQINLTAIREPAQIRIRHFLDAVSCAQVTGNLNGRSLIDVGTGAGFPGLPLKILFPQLKLTLLESVQKKARFLHTVVDELVLDDVTVIAERAETVGQLAEHREKYDWAVARAVAEMRVLVELLLPFCRVGGFMLAQKGGSATQETAVAEKAINLLGGRHMQTSEIYLPGREEPHYLVVLEKQEPTPAKYPRRVGMPAKRPL